MTEQDTFNRLSGIKVVEFWVDTYIAKAMLDSFIRPYWDLEVDNHTITYYMNEKHLSSYVEEIQEIYPHLDIDLQYKYGNNVEMRFTNKE